MQGYGTDGESERICGELFEGMRREDFVIQTKWFVVSNVTNVLSPAPIGSHLGVAALFISISPSVPQQYYNG